MQSLMGNRLLELFLKSTRRRGWRTRSERAESKAESEGALAGLPDRTSDHSTDGVVHSQSDGGQQGGCGETQVPNEPHGNKDFLVEHAAPVSSDDMEGGKG